MKTSKHIMEEKLQLRGVISMMDIYLDRLDESLSENRNKPTLAQIRARRENIRKAQAERWG